MQNYEELIKEIKENEIKRKEEDKKNKKIIEQVKIIEKLEYKLKKAKEKLNELAQSNDNAKVKSSKELQ